MWPISPMAQETITTSHRIAVRATATTAHLGSVTVPVSGGSVTADATSQVRYTASVIVPDPTLWPANPFDVLSPLGSELFVEYGIVLPNGNTEWVPLITGVITDVERTLPVGSQGLTVTLADRSSKVAEDEYITPTQIAGDGTTTYIQALTQLVQHMYPNVITLDSTGNTVPCPMLTIEKSRWSDGVEQITVATYSEAFFDQVGRLVVRLQPTLNGPVVWQAKVGNDGVIVTKQDSQKRELVYNQVVASGMSSDGTTPVYAVAQDTDPTSPTYYLGPFGSKTRRYQSALLTTQAQALSVAQALLARAQGEQAVVQLTNICNPALAPGDIIAVSTPNDYTLFIVDKVVTPLDPGTAQQITTRTKYLPPES